MACNNPNCINESCGATYTEEELAQLDGLQAQVSDMEAQKEALFARINALIEASETFNPDDLADANAFLDRVEKELADHPEALAAIAVLIGSNIQMGEELEKLVAIIEMLQQQGGARGLPGGFVIG